MSANASASLSTLQALLSHLEVDMAALHTRRGRGVVDMVDQGNTGDGDSHTGTLHKSTIMDVPVTVVSGLDMDLDERDLLSKSQSFPQSVRLELLKQAGPAKTFSVMILLQDLDAFSLFCRATIGKRALSALRKTLL
jgi:hypothetical protein